MQIRQVGSYCGGAVRCAAPVLVAALTIIVIPQQSFGFDPLNGDFTRANPLDIRVVAYNHNRNFIDDSSTDAAFNRILTALDPDIISFEEFPSGISVSDVENRMNSIIPIGGSGWQVHFGLIAGIRTVICSRYPLLDRRIDTIPASSTRGVTLALADLPDGSYSEDIYLLAVHLKCCGNPGGSEDASRQDSADAMVNWMADARGLSRPSGNNIALVANTPMIALGDFNLVGGPQPEQTILTGDIQDTGAYGPSASPDWDNTDLTNLNPLDPFTGDNFTWQGSSNYDPSPLDRMFYTDSVITVANSFVLNTDTMSGSALSNAGLQAGDTLPWNSSDHLPIVMDLSFGSGGCSSDPECDDGVFCNGAETCVGSTCQSGTPPICDDGVACTVDSCNAGSNSCVYLTNEALCNNGLFCDGVETCNATTGCQSGTPIDCNDGVVCTDDTCNEATNSCESVANDANCDNGLFCDGAETCHATLDCQVGVSVDCNDGVACTDDSCNEATDSCDNIANDGNCDNGLFCDGAETCNAQAGCLSGADPCGGVLWCAESNDVCNSYGNGDFDGDLDVDLVDFHAFQACFGQSAESVSSCSAGNLEGPNGIIDLSDYALFSTSLDSSGP